MHTLDLTTEYAESAETLRQRWGVEIGLRQGKLEVSTQTIPSFPSSVLCGEIRAYEWLS